MSVVFLLLFTPLCFARVRLSVISRRVKLGSWKLVFFSLLGSSRVKGASLMGNPRA